MAKIVVYSLAYRGDVFPYVPIASELSRRGHDVTFVTAREFHPSFAAEPFKVAHAGSDSLAPVSLASHSGFIDRWAMRANGALLLRLFMAKLTVPFLDQFYDTLLAESQDADVILSHPMAGLIGSMVAETLDIPWISGDLFPMVVPSETRPPVGFPNAGPRGNRMFWKIARSKLGAPLTSERDLAKFRKGKGLDDTRQSLIDAVRSPHLNLGMTSAHYVPVAHDWPKNYKVTGFSLWDGPNGGNVDDDVLQFLDAGEPPVLVTLGTSAASTDRFLRVMEQLDKTGQRGLFLASSTEVADALKGQDTAGRHGVWPFVPLAGVLPRCRAVVQSGAHGTNAMVLSAGLPSVSSPVLFDQVWHAKRQVELGTGLYAKKTDHLAEAITTMLNSPNMARKAQDFGALLAEEDGVANAGDAVESFLRNPTGPVH